VTDRRSVVESAVAWQSTPLRLAGKVAVVTGGSRGIGRAIVQTFAEAGAAVVIASRKLDSCEAAATEVREQTGVDAFPFAAHVGRWDDCQRLVDAAVDRFGAIDVLVNNAGMSPLYPSLAEVSEDLFDKVVSVNLKGPFRLGALAATHMAGRGGGSIINISTTASLVAAPRELPYACAKAGLNTLTAGLAEAFAPHVRVNTIVPGMFRTDVSKAWPEDPRVDEVVPMQRLGEPNEVAMLALYLASDAAAYTTGAMIRVDGGLTRRV
jgi:NAD(P)-dependent dehydrogenase (short-subunit alcohol dehydrogenase family)